ncbi:MAG: adenylyl-sulfate kinase [Eubacterium sp.]|nr:adenylyl-sulfate kinase [Eubacterium sp.]
MSKNENLVWHEGDVSREMREEALGQKGLVVWFTGLSGSGKSTVAVEVEKRLRDLGKIAYRLDGDNIRIGINSDLGFSDADRSENIRRIAEISALFQDVGIVTLVSCISPSRQMRRFARSRVPGGQFVEVYMDTDFETCAKRDPKGLYKKDIKNFTGKDSSYEVPENPEIRLDTVANSVEECGEIVLRKILERIQ